MKEVTWKELCFKHAGGLVEELGYDCETEVPPGGWGGLIQIGCVLPWPAFPNFPTCFEVGQFVWRILLG